MGLVTDNGLGNGLAGAAAEPGALGPWRSSRSAARATAWAAALMYRSVPAVTGASAAAISRAGQAQVVGSVTSSERGRSLRSLIHPIVLRSSFLAPPTRL